MRRHRLAEYRGEGRLRQTGPAGVRALRLRPRMGALSPPLWPEQPLGARAQVGPGGAGWHRRRARLPGLRPRTTLSVARETARLRRAPDGRGPWHRTRYVHASRPGPSGGAYRHIPCATAAPAPACGVRGGPEQRSRETAQGSPPTASKRLESRWRYPLPVPLSANPARRRGNGSPPPLSKPTSPGDGP